uniref:Jacalin-type lectin domain-containing protein n=1 Tax=Brassica oleracea TaxID=3712 RepID=A0A3P6FV26_BRAOL|nr:unnamed protein product [Brassica oleracea]
MAQKVEAQGGKGGNQWDDGSEHDAVTKIQNGQTEEAPLRGIKGRSIPADPFVINHPEEHLVSVEGWYNPEGLIQGLKFNSNKKSSDVIGYNDGTSFTLQVQDKKIVGFHGFAGDYVHSLGAYFAPLTSSTSLTPAKKLPALGSQGHDGVSAVKFEYVNGSEVVAGDERGKPTLLGFEEFELDYPSEYITVVHGTVDKIFGSDSAIITMLKFETNKRTSNPFGLEAGASFKVKEEGHKIVGFHGKANELLHQIGVHVLPITN